MEYGFTKKAMSFEGEIEYTPQTSSSSEQVKIGGRRLIDMLIRMGYKPVPYTLGEHARIRISIEILEPRSEFLEFRG